MADAKKYYYMRLNENYFDTDEQKVLESMPDGYLYSNILLKLYLKSLKRDGLLMFNERIPYNAQMIATITRHQIGTVEKALELFRQMGIVEILDSGAIYMLDVQNFVGKTSTEADRIRAYRSRIEGEKATLESGCTNVQAIPYKCTPEIEIELEPEIKSESELQLHGTASSDAVKPADVQRVIDSWNSLGLNKVKAINPDTSRYAMLRKRLKDYGVDTIVEGVDKIRNSSFLQGHNNKGWTVTFDWFIKPDNFQKVIDGNYDDRKAATQNTKAGTERMDDLDGIF